MNTRNWIDFIVKETESALTLLYSHMAFYDALNDKELLNSVNGNVDFWRVHTSSIQHTLFLYLGRLSDDSRKGKSFSDFNNHCILNIQDFSRESFLERRGEVLKINPSYLDNTSFPKKEDLFQLFSLSKNANKYLRAECKTIRSFVYAHAILTEEHENFHLFNKVKLPEIEESLLAMWSVSQHLWQSFHNARTIESKLLTFSEEKDTIFKATKKAIKNDI